MRFLRSPSTTRRPPDDKSPSRLATCKEKYFPIPERNFTRSFHVATNDKPDSPSIGARGENTMFDAKYNSLFDNTLVRIVVNCALFVVWAGVAYGSLAAR
jgi:hypothetical protein